MEGRPEDRRGEKGQGEGEGPVDPRPYLCIPYWAAPNGPDGNDDTGAKRPLEDEQNGVISWECPSLRASQYKPGERLDVEVDVRNSGAGSAPAIVAVLVYWVEMSAGFPPRTGLFGVASVAVSAGGGMATAKLSAAIPADAGWHICLLAKATHPLDPAGAARDPFNDRHWAQRNVTWVEGAPGTPAAVPFGVANPFPDADLTFRLQVQMLEFDSLRELAERLGVSPADGGLGVRLLDEDGEAIGEGREAVVDLPIEAGGERRLNLELEPTSELGGDLVTAVRAVLLVDGEVPAGSFGVVLHGPGGGPNRDDP